MKGQPRVLLLSVITDDSVLKQMQQAARDIAGPNAAVEIVEDALTLVN
jgi:hypothetical protein